MAIKFSQKVVEEKQENLGGYLRAHRTFKGIELDEVHAKTMIKVQFIEAIENNTLHELIDIRFARMHILNYARFIGANINKTMTLYAKQYNQDEKKQSTPSTKKQKTEKKVLIPRVFFKLAALLVIVAVLFVIGLHLQQKGVLHRNLFEDKSTVNGQIGTELLSNPSDLEQTQVQEYSYKKEDLYKKYILKGKDVPWHIFPKYAKNK